MSSAESQRFKGKTVIVTGGTAGIGQSRAFVMPRAETTTMYDECAAENLAPKTNHRSVPVKTSFLALIFCSFVASAPLSAQQGGPAQAVPKTDFELIEDIAYADRDSVRNLLDIYLPHDVENPPVVVTIHGGGFFLGDKSEPTGLDLFLRAGFAVVSINYRLSDTTQWPGQLEDLTDAFAFVRANGETYGYDRTRIASFGASAGGHLSAMAGISLADDDATRLEASVAWFPPILFTEMDADAARIGMIPKTGSTAEAGSAESRLIGGAVGENPELAIAASPINYLDALPSDTPMPDFLIMHGAKDTNIARGQSGRLFAALLNHEGVAGLEYHLLPDGDHGGGEFDRLDPILTVVEFLENAFE
jgi:acetyl esterase/lipase